MAKYIRLLIILVPFGSILKYKKDEIGSISHTIFNSKTLKLFKVIK